MHTHIWKLTYWSTWRHGMCSTRHHPAYVGCLSDLNYNEMATAGRKRREDIWVNFTFDVKTNKTLCKPCGAEIAGKNTTNLKRHLQGNHPEIHAKVSTTFLLILFCQLTSVGVLLHNWNSIASHWPVLIREVTLLERTLKVIDMLKINGICCCPQTESVM